MPSANAPVTGSQPDARPASGEPVEFWTAWDEFFAAMRRVRGRAAREDGLTISQFRLLCAVQRCPDAGLRELAEEVGASAPTVTRMLAGLERDGIVTREASARGQRRVCVTLTASGREVLEAKRSQVEARRAAVYSSLRPEERAQLQHLLPRLAEALDAL
ncbi:MarR family winged helix-turn-helix transcriptional regulator [Sporichthya polymorpha]|uniref:MarR family winged helix-turn-helix transcriptional regulator n=1 Tax=Sporichthya polymorpha TaxID=35751 RepID=UPI00036B1068|nr:MarR family transcriptional regulator [Sporichthya polymorpha]